MSLIGKEVKPKRYELVMGRTTHVSPIGKVVWESPDGSKAQVEFGFINPTTMEPVREVFPVTQLELLSKEVR